MLLPDNTLVVAMPNQRQFVRSLANTGSVSHFDQSENATDKAVSVSNGLRDELFCPLCHDPFVNPVMPSCCFATFCDACIRKFLAASDQPQCPICGSTECTIAVLKPNLHFQKAVDDFIDANLPLPSPTTPLKVPPSVVPSPNDGNLVCVLLRHFCFDLLIPLVDELVAHGGHAM